MQNYSLPEQQQALTAFINYNNSINAAYDKLHSDLHNIFGGNDIEVVTFRGLYAEGYEDAVKHKQQLRCILFAAFARADTLFFIN